MHNHVKLNGFAHFKKFCAFFSVFTGDKLEVSGGKLRASGLTVQAIGSIWY